MTTVAILGDGNVGAAVGRRLAAAGHAVVFGVRAPAPADDALPRLPLADATRGAAVVLVAVPAAAARDALAAAAPAPGTIVVDATNPLRWEAGPVPAPPPEGSAAAALAAVFPALRVVKALNHFGAEVHAHPTTLAGAAEAYLAADDADAKATVGELLASAGFAPVDAGPLRNAALLEALAALWIHLATVGGAGRRFAFTRTPLRD